MAFSMKLALLCVLLFVANSMAQTAPPNITISALEHSRLYVMTTWTDDGVPLINNVIMNDDDAGLIMCDTNYAGTFAAVRAALDQLSTDNVSILINTHYHADHTGLNADFRAHGTNTIMALHGVKEALAVPHLLRDLNFSMDAQSNESFPNVFVHDHFARRHHHRDDYHHYSYQLLHTHHEQIELIAVPAAPAHSNADLLVFFKRANVMFTGDIYFAHMFPVFDRTYGASITSMIRAAHYLLSITNKHTRYVASHGPLSTRQQVYEYVHMLEMVHERMHELLEQEPMPTEDDVIHDAQLTALDAEWSHGFLSTEMFVRMVYRDLTDAPAS